MPTFERIEIQHTCPACNADSLVRFYGASGIPTQSNLLLRTLDEALAQTAGDLELAYCRVCGFITNLRFDPSSQQLDSDYEATQAFSATFNTFARSLAEQWIARYGLGPRTTALEIGCGGGEFVELLSELAGCSAIGIDPIVDPARSRDNVRFIRGKFDETLTGLWPDFICCRHTLEHVPDVNRFVATIRKALKDRNEVPVCFEVPDTLRVLREGAFWDVYYEHCSYFTPGSMARLFRRCGFDVADLRLEFDGQYIILESLPASGDASKRTPAIENDLAATNEAIETFTRLCETKLREWREVIDRAASDGRRLALWGSGSKAVGFLTTLNIDRRMLPHVVDINPHKQGTFLPTTGQQIVAPEQLRSDQPRVVIAMNPVYRKEIRDSLDLLGLRDTELLTL